jgi:hypothetical protein
MKIVLALESPQSERETLPDQQRLGYECSGSSESPQRGNFEDSLGSLKFDDSALQAYHRGVGPVVRA